jgi:dihydroneopterin aldolase
MKLLIKNLRVQTIIGVHAWEKNTPRDLFITLEIEFDGTKAAKSDSIADTPNYDDISKILTQETEKSRFELIEKLAVHLLYKIMEDERISYAKIEISKPGAVPAAETVSVIEEIKR